MVWTKSYCNFLMPTFLLKNQVVWTQVYKVATKNRQNRQLAEYGQSAKTKLAEEQILCEKLVSQASFE